VRGELFVEARFELIQPLGEFAVRAEQRSHAHERAVRRGTMLRTICGAPITKASSCPPIGATVTPLNARLGDFPIHFAAQIGGNTAQLHVQPVAGAAAGQTEDKFNPRLFQRMMLSNDAAAMPL
jgi:hypothetical protein